MHTIVDRDFVREHAKDVLKSFGLMAYLRALRTPEKGLLQQMTEKYLAEGIPMPGPIGNAYKLSAILELRAARIYARMAERFHQNQLVREFFEELRDEEEEHGRIMTLCLYTIDGKANADFVPSVRDPDNRALMQELRAVERNAWKLSLDEALDVTEKLEASEVNVIFDRLLKQAQNPKSELFVSQLAKAEGHASAVPKRIKALRERLG
jgi:rubrerythrin